MKMNRLLYLLLPALLLTLAGCAVSISEPAPSPAAAAEEIAAAVPDPSLPTVLDLNDPETPVSGVSYENGIFTISEAGTYRITGTLEGQLLVDTDDPAELILAGVYIRGPEAVSILSDSPVTVTTEAGTENVLYDGIEAADENTAAVLRSNAPLTLDGEGSLTVLAGGHNGIQSKSILTVAGGSITVKAAHHGIKADSFLTVSGGKTDITAGADALRSEAGRISYGDVYIMGGAVTAAASGRGIQADGTVTVVGGSVSLTSAEDGIKGAYVTVSGGEITAASACDGIQAEYTLSVTGGTLSLTAGEDGLHGASVDLRGGNLTLNATGDGIQADTTLSLLAGTVSAVSGEDGLRGEDISLNGGSVTLEAAGDGIQADRTVTVSGGTLSAVSGEDGIRGEDISIESGSVTLDAGSDGLQADALLMISGGELSVTTAGGGGGAINKAGDAFFRPRSDTQTTALEVSAKGLKSDGDIEITGGVIDLNTADDAVHAAALLTIDGGELTILATDDALHADDMLVIHDGSVNIVDCFEGIEAFAIEVRGGDIVIRAVNDGINANGSEFGMFGFGPWGRSDTETEQEITSLSGQATTYYLQTGGTVDLVVTGNTNNVGDGIDSNGYVTITGGVLTVSTFGNTQEGGIDTGRDGPVVTGGMVMAGGASMMQETWAGDSTQCCAVIYCDLQPGGTPVTVYDEDGNEIWTVTLANTFNCIVLSHPDLQPGHVYTVDYGGGTETLDFTESINLRVGTSSWGWGFPGRW